MLSTEIRKAVLSIAPSAKNLQGIAPSMRNYYYVIAQGIDRPQTDPIITHDYCTYESSSSISVMAAEFEQTRADVAEELTGLPTDPPKNWKRAICERCR